MEIAHIERLKETRLLRLLTRGPMRHGQETKKAFVGMDAEFGAHGEHECRLVQMELESMSETSKVALPST